MDHSTTREPRFQPDPTERTDREVARLKAGLAESPVVSFARDRLLRLAARSPDTAPRTHVPSPDQTEHLAHALICDDEMAGAQFVIEATRVGASIEVVYLTYLAGAARLLGHWWEEGHITFVEVAIGSSRIASIMRASNDLFTPSGAPGGKSALFATVPGETHTIGLRMAADLFRKDGWDIDLRIGRSHEELLRDIGRSGHRVIGLSAGGRHAAEPLARLVGVIRTGHPDARIMVSGKIVQDDRALVSSLGLDGLAEDFPTAQAIMDRLCKTSPSYRVCS